MKKNAVRKLQLSRETLQALTSLEIQAVAGGASYQFEFSCPSDCRPACPGPG